jgi:hypothetical protein
MKKQPAPEIFISRAWLLEGLCPRDAAFERRALEQLERELLAEAIPGARHKKIRQVDGCRLSRRIFFGRS